MSDFSPDQDADVIATSVPDPALFAALVDRHGPMVLRYLTRRVGPSLAEDLAAETFLRAFRSRQTYRSEHGSALPWLYGIATNLLRNHARSEQRRTEVLGRMAAQIAFDDGQQRVDDALTAASTLQKLTSTFQSLSAAERDVLVLVAIEGLAYQEAACALGVPIGTVRSRLARARSELRQALAELPHPAFPDTFTNVEKGDLHG